MWKALLFDRTGRERIGLGVAARQDSIFSVLSYTYTISYICYVINIFLLWNSFINKGFSFSFLANSLICSLIDHSKTIRLSLFVSSCTTNSIINTTNMFPVTCYNGIIWICTFLGQRCLDIRRSHLSFPSKFQRELCMNSSDPCITLLLGGGPTITRKCHSSNSQMKFLTTISGQENFFIMWINDILLCASHHTTGLVRQPNQ